MSDRFGPRTIDADLVKDMWSEIKLMRDKMFNWELQARHGQERLDKMLARMKEARMDEWIPTIEEVQAAWRDDGKSVELDQEPQEVERDQCGNCR